MDGGGQVTPHQYWPADDEERERKREIIGENKMSNENTRFTELRYGRRDSS